jgi:glycosyltransferase involved in cell wall biosynthesis
MRIAYITQSYPPMVSGAAIFAHQIAEAMSKRGHQVLVITASDGDKPHRTQKGNMTVLRLSSHHNPLRVGQRFLLYPRRATLQALCEFQPDIIHTHEPLQMGNLGLEYARRMRIPITLTNHQLPWFAASYLPNKFGIRELVENILWVYARWILPQFTSIIAPTQTISDFITKKTNIKSQTISYGIDLGSLHPLHDLNEEIATRTRLNLPSSIPVLLYVGRLDTDKSVDRVIIASAPILRETDTHLVIVGDGCQKTALMKLCESFGITDRVKFTGCISMQDGLPEIYRIANVFVTASEIETQGIVLLEAAASGLPIAAVRATCIPEIVRHGLNGYLAESGDIKALENNMRILLKDPLKARKMGEAGRALIESHTAQHTVDLYEKFYQGLLLQTSMQLMSTKLARRRKLMRGWTKL